MKCLRSVLLVTVFLLLVGCLTFDGKAPPTAISSLHNDGYSYETIDLNIKLDDLNKVLGTSYATMADAAKAIVWTGTTFNTTVQIEKADGSLEVIPVTASASANYKNIFVSFDYIKYSAWKAPDADRKALLEKHPGAQDVAVLIGGHVTFQCKIKTANISLSGSLVGALSAALSAGATTVEVNGNSYGIVGDDVTMLLGIANKESQDSLAQVGAILQIIGSLTGGVKIEPTIVGYRYTPARGWRAEAISVIHTPQEAQRLTRMQLDTPMK
jgi:hypothetical protein